MTYCKIYLNISFLSNNSAIERHKFLYFFLFLYLFKEKLSEFADFSIRTFQYDVNRCWANQSFSSNFGTIYESFCLAHSGQMMSGPSVMKPRPTSEVLQQAQMKQSLCQCLSSNDMKRVPPIPANN